jgi:hypothetical protein
LRQVLTRESRRDDVHVREGLDIPYVRGEEHVGEAVPEHIRSTGVDLAQQLRFVTCAVKAELEAADACEESRDSQ